MPAQLWHDTGPAPWPTPGACLLLLEAGPDTADTASLYSVEAAETETQCGPGDSAETDSVEGDLSSSSCSSCSSTTLLDTEDEAEVEGD